ncbi:MAG TPA: aspartate ammonia-lyase [Pseudoclavibacter sp.]|nr:aspartate ammonia-lyase [Pseudoclavibacter sp.]
MNTTTDTPFRIETDLIGQLAIPADRYYGVHTQRAIDNFPITHKTIGSYPHFVYALAAIKRAAATVNNDLGLLSAHKADAIIQACDRVMAGEFLSEFAVGTIQGGAGTSTNMNANEVIANVALEGLGKPKGEYEDIDPHNDVNMCQSTNDVYPTAIKIALLLMIDDLLQAMRLLAQSFGAKAEEFSSVIKLGRTQLQDAVPMTLGQEFSTYQVMISEDVLVLRSACDLLREVNIGGTAIGTGINTPEGFADRMVVELSRVTGVELSGASNLVEATQDVGSFVQLSGTLKRVAVKISKVCNDLRLLSSGPRAGLGEINLPPAQAGSSIMPGKVNPVIPEVVNQVAFEVIGHDVTISMAAEAGQLQLNAFEPIVAHSLFEEIRHLERAFDILRLRCVDGITANVARMRSFVWESVSIVTALSPTLGYEEATRVAKQALEEGVSIPEIVEREELLSEEELHRALDPESLTHPWIPVQ